MEQQKSLSIRLQYGKRSKKHHRRYIQHEYRDRSNEKPGIKDNCTIMLNSIYPYQLNSSAFLKLKKEDLEKKGIKRLTFPLKLHILLDYVQAEELSHIVSWQSHGRAFKIHKEKEFVDNVMPLFFKNIKLSSFKRQLNHYSFERITQGHDRGAYHHELFLQGVDFLASKMMRTKVKGTKVRGATSPGNEPDFYKFPKVNDSSKPPLVMASTSLCNANDEMNPHYFQQLNPNSFLNGEMDVDVSSLGYDTSDDEVTYCHEEEMCALIEQHQNPLNLPPKKRDTLDDEWSLENISLESKGSDQLKKQHFSRQELLFMCTFLGGTLA
jgi:hypothetical protein